MVWSINTQVIQIVAAVAFYLVANELQGLFRFFFLAANELQGLIRFYIERARQLYTRHRKKSVTFSKGSSMHVTFAMN